MPLITAKNDVLAIYREAQEYKWVLPCFCSENLTTTEAVLEAVRIYAQETGYPDLPIIIAITNNYSHRPQSHYYTQTRMWQIGIRLFLSDLKVLAAKESPYSKLRIMVHLDHIQHDADAELLSWDMSQFSSIMYDASNLPFAENIRLTSQFVAAQGNNILVEGACDEIVDAAGSVRSELTTPDRAETYMEQTGSDLIVANLGTEHRASDRKLHYYSEYARGIRKRIGTKIVLHGASSVAAEDIAGLFDDGVCKVNLWTTLERDSSPLLFADMVAHACEIAGSPMAEQLKKDGLLGPSSHSGCKPDLNYCTTSYRQSIIFQVMTDIVYNYLKLWYLRGD